MNGELIKAVDTYDLFKSSKETLSEWYKKYKSK